MLELPPANQRDVFLCHAHADKELFVRPVAEALRSYGVSSWLDEAEIRVGDHIAAKINEGLRESRFVVVFVTSTFMKRNWPLAELHAAFGMEARKGEVVVLPILAVPAEDWAGKFPLFAEKMFLAWSIGIPNIVHAIAERVGVLFKEHWLHHFPAAYEGAIWIRVLTFGTRRGNKHKVTLRWGPWRARKAFKTAEPAVCLVQAKAADEFSVPLFLTVTPPANVSFGMGHPPCAKSIDTSHSWWRVHL